MIRSFNPVLENVTLSDTGDPPAATPPKLTQQLLCTNLGAVVWPCPLTEIGTEPALVVMLSAARMLPLTVGEKVIGMLIDCPAARVAGNVGVGAPRVNWLL